MTTTNSNRLELLLKRLEQVQPTPQPQYTDPEAFAKIMQQGAKNNGIMWNYGETELQALDMLLNGTKWVLLIGSIGTGKTMLLRWFKMAAKFVDRETDIQFISSVEFSMRYLSEGESVILDNKSGLMCIDDIGAEQMAVSRYGTKSDPIAQLLFLRYESKARTFCTTNLDADQLRKRYGNRLSDRFKEMFEVVTFKGGSKR